MNHKFAIGQQVCFTPTGPGAVAGNYEVCRIMPSSDYQQEPRYRIKSAAERHERVVSQSLLTLPNLL
ncbi:MAG: hypothetical protein ACLPWS_17220 [Rhodomicrobium sp.]